MGLPKGRALALGLSSWGLGLLALALAFERDTPLFLNLGAGDASFARGFRGGGQGDARSQSGDTMFRWTEDGSRLEFPVVVASGRLSARMRLARFAPSEADIALQLPGGSVAERWRQPVGGWAVREFDLGELRGNLMLRFRFPAGDALGVALDWAEIRGATRLLPQRELLPGLLLALFCVPATAAICAGLGAGLVVAVFVTWAGAGAVFLDRLGGLVALAESGPPALAVVALVGLAHAVLRRVWPEQLEARAALVVPCAAAALLCLALFNPFFYSPNVDTHARFLQAIRADTWAAFDPTESHPFFHLAAWPLAPFLGDSGAVKAAAVASLGLTLLLVFGLVRALGLPAPWAILGQCLLALLPVIASRLSLALFPTLFGQAMEALLGLHLVRRFAHLDGARDAAAAAFFLFIAQAANTGSLFNVASLVGVLAALEAAAGEHRRALRLLAAYAVAAAAVAALLYARLIPSLIQDVLPHLRGTVGAGDAAAVPPLLRLTTFYDALLPGLALLGVALSAGAPPHARRYFVAALVAGAALLGLRSVAPTLLRDAKDVELLALPVVALAVCSLRRLWASGTPMRLGALAVLTAVLLWCVSRDVAFYTARFVAIDR